MAEAEKPDLTTLTVQLLSAYVSNNTVASEALAGLIVSTRTALAGETAPETPAEAVFTPAVSVRKSLASRDHILSLIDGKPYRSLKRHLSSHGLSPVEYRARYKLAADYPMVAPGYSEQRREVARRLGLGRRKVETVVVAETPAAPVAPPPSSPDASAVKQSTPSKAKASKAATATPAVAKSAPEKAVKSRPRAASDGKPSASGAPKAAKAEPRSQRKAAPGKPKKGVTGARDTATK